MPNAFGGVKGGFAGSERVKEWVRIKLWEGKTGGDGRKKAQESQKFPEVRSIQPQGSLEIFRSQPGVAGDSGQHAWSDLFAVMKCENKVRPGSPGKDAVRTALTLHAPTDLKKCGQD